MTYTYATRLLAEPLSYCRETPTSSQAITLARRLSRTIVIIGLLVRQVEGVNVSRSGNEFFLECSHYVGDHPSSRRKKRFFIEQFEGGLKEVEPLVLA